MQSVQNKILSIIYGHGRAWSFSQKDFLRVGSRKAIDIALYRLMNYGKIRRVIRGIYDYPKYSELLKQQLSPDFDQVAHAIARKNSWRIHACGEAALNLLGLSSQVPGTVIYLSDGPQKTINIGNLNIEFKKTSLKEMKIKHTYTSLTVQALKALGKENIDDKVINKISKNWTSDQRLKMSKDAQYVTGWIYEYIRQICSEGIDE